MIAYIEGKLAQAEPAFVIIDINGLGYYIRISLQTYSSINKAQDERLKLHTYMHIKEDAHTLYGFFELAEKDLFVDLISVSGIGPNTAMVMLSSLSSFEIKKALANEDIKSIQSIKGIGAKTAERAIVELKAKFKKEILTGTPSLIDYTSPAHALKAEALQALTTLGIARAVAEKSIDQILTKEGYQIGIEQLIKMALK